MKLQNLTNLNKVPKGLPEDADGKAAYLERISHQAINAIWPKTKEDTIKKIAESARKDIFCICKEFKGRQNIEVMLVTRHNSIRSNG